MYFYMHIVGHVLFFMYLLFYEMFESFLCLFSLAKVAGYGDVSGVVVVCILVLVVFL